MNQNRKNGPEGLGGWLLIPAIALVLVPVKILVADSYFCRSLLEANPGLHGEVRFWLLWVIDFLIIGFMALTATYFYRRKKETPKVFISYLAMSALGALLQALLMINLTLRAPTYDAFLPFIGTLVAAVVWSLYFLKSQRVKNTFVR